MSSKLQGIALTGMRYGERSKIMRILTREEGLLSFIVHPERSKRKSSRSALYQPCTIIEIEAKLNPKKDLHSISDVRLGEATMDIHMREDKRSQAMFIADLVAHSVQEENADTDLFDYLKTAILWLDACEEAPSFHLGVMLGLCHFWGIYPQTEEGRHFDQREGRFQQQRPLHPDFTEGVRAATLRQLCGMDLDALAQYKMGRELRNELVDDLMKYYTIQIGHFKGLLSHRILQETFEADDK